MDELTEIISNLKTRRDTAQGLYNTTKDDAVKVRLLEKLMELDEKIRCEEYKLKVIQGEE